MGKSRVFRKIFVTFIALSMMYVLVAVSLWFYQSVEMHRMEMANSHETFLQQAAEQIDTKIKVALTMVNQYRVEEELLLYARDRERNYYHITRVHDKLGKKLDAFNNFGYTLDLLNVHDDLVITPQATVKLNAYYEQSGFGEETVAQINQLLRPRESGSLLVITNDSTQSRLRGERLTLVKKELLQGRNEIAFFISFSVDTLLPDLATRDGEFIMWKDGMSLGQRSLRTEPLLQDLLTAGNWQTDMFGKGEWEVAADRIYARKSEALGGLTYYLAAPDRAVGSAFPVQAINMLVIFLLLLLCGAILAYWLSGRLYRPIKRLSGLFDSEQAATGNPAVVVHDEWAYIHDQTIRIRDANRKLSDLLQHHRQPLQHKFLRDLLTGLIPREKIASEAGQFGLPLVNRQLAIVVIEFPGTSQLDEQFDEGAFHEIKQQAMHVIEEELGSETGACAAFGWDHRRFVIVTSGIVQQRLHEQVGSQLLQMEEAFDLRMVAAVSDPVDRPDALEAAFLMAWQLLEHRPELDRRHVLRAADLQGLKRSGYFYPLRTEIELITLAINGKHEQAMALLNRILAENLQQRQLSDVDKSALSAALAATMQRLKQQLDSREEELQIALALHVDDLKMAGDVHEWTAQVQAVFRALLDAIDDSRDTGDSKQKDRLLAYIHAHYDQDLSLSDAASHFNLSDGYFSNFFKTQVGSNFKDYLNMYRIAKAKEWLAQGQDMPIVEIGRKLGFNHVNTFLRLFKKYEGISPGQYAKQMTAEKDC